MRKTLLLRISTDWPSRLLLRLLLIACSHVVVYVVEKCRPWESYSLKWALTPLQARRSQAEGDLQLLQGKCPRPHFVLVRKNLDWLICLPETAHPASQMMPLRPVTDSKLVLRVHIGRGHPCVISVRQLPYMQGGFC
eukprot:1133575-Pelagomonas_calceolata.AAC.4